jgi:ligand-binding sensor domain-containing protein/signal transduction histidine kinase
MRCVWRTIAGLVCAAVCPPQLSALNPAYRISQYLHTSWKSDSGLQAVRRVAQTPDGYLWLATRGGLVRFDGVRFSTYRAGSVPGLENSTAQDLLVDPDGSLWVATLGGGISHYQQGTFRSYTTRDGLPSDDVQSLYRDTRGVMWVGTRDGKIARLVQGRFEKVSLGIPESSVTGFVETADQSLWIATFGNGVFRLRDGVLTAFSVKDGLPDSRVTGLYRDRSGKIWTTGWKGVSFWDGKRFIADSTVNKSVEYAIGCREDRDGNLWIAASSGLFRAQKDTVVKLDRNSGLSSDFTSDVFEDRDGNLWVATRAGLDRLRDGPLRTFTTKEGLAGGSGPIVVGDGGAIWTIAGGQVDRIAANELSTWRAALPSPAAQSVMWISQPDSALLVGFDSGVLRWRPNGAATTIPALAGLDVQCLLKARDGTIWIGTQNRGLLRWKPSPGSGASLEAVVPDKAIAALAEDHAGAIWAGSYFGGGLYQVKGEKVQHFGQAEGLKSSYVYTVFVDEKSDVWIGSTAGLSWFQNGTIRTVNSQQGLPSDQVFGIVNDSYGRLWVTTFAGIASLERKSLTEWAEGRRDRLNPTVYRATDEMQIYAVGRTFPNAVRSNDGHLWFAFANGVAEVTPPVPGASQENDFPVLIEDVRIDGIPRPGPSRFRIPPGSRSIEIAYTAIALSNPESVRFRYRLEGLDPAWVNADARRVAFYDNLKPGSYTFTVAASSGAGQWREASPVVMEQLPFFYQTTWFALLVLTAVLSLGILSYRFRVQQAVNRIQAAFQERIDERTRVARDLHDTLLQSFQGVLLKFYAVTYRLPDRPEAREELEGAIEQARQAIAEGRDAVQGLRSSVVVKNDLARAITTFGEGLASDQNGRQAPDFHVLVEGVSRDLAPLVRDEVYRIAGEALRNAFRHAGARRIEVEIHYETRHLRMRIRDDGKGIDPQVLSAGERGGHHGLPGMRERAELVGGKLAVWSEVNSGTEIELVIPSVIAYAKAQAIKVG